jgi:hypothetical protein
LVAGVDREFFAGTKIKSNFICSLGYGDPASLFPHNPRLSHEEAGGSREAFATMRRWNHGGIC